MVIAADFEAAFESVSWTYLKAVFKKYNFGPTFINVINLMYLNEQNYSRIMLNGYLGNKICLQGGIRQGDPASGYLFNLAVEVLSTQINKSRQLNGINISPTKEIRISQYADDTILLLDGSNRSLKGALDELRLFAKSSGLKVNVEKTSCLPIGTLSASQVSTDLNIKLVQEIKILGIYVTRCIDDITERNVRLKIPMIKREIEQWRRRNLTPVGKICIIKSLLLSKLVHLFMALPNPPRQQIKEIESMLFGFIWDNKGDKIKRTKLVQNYAGDGLNMVDIDCFINSMKLAWLKRLAESQADWTYLAYEQLPHVFRLLTYGKEKLARIRSKTTNQFYVDLISALIKFAIEHKPNAEEIASETIWFSDHTKFSKTIVKRWDENGLRFISDLFNPTSGRLYSKEQLEEGFEIQMTFLCYESLVRSLPSKLRNGLNTSELSNPNIPYKIGKVMNENKFSKLAYNTFVTTLSKNNAVSDQKVKTKWENDTGDYVTGTLLEIKNATLSSYLLYLHYRIIARIFPTNKFLYTINIKPTNNCSFCNGTVETLTHLFWFCPKVQFFIKEILSHLRTKYNKKLNINVVKWFFLKDVSSVDALIITVAKSVIHKARLNETNPVLPIMLNSLKLEASKEYYGAKFKGSLGKFERKWGELKRIVT